MTAIADMEHNTRIAVKIFLIFLKVYINLIRNEELGMRNYKL
jgi:hypothetical protein